MHRMCIFSFGLENLRRFANISQVHECVDCRALMGLKRTMDCHHVIVPYVYVNHRNLDGKFQIPMCVTSKESKALLMRYHVQCCWLA